ncbi:MAG TPA: EAL domain-containing protein [Thermoleophilaceae bacterium]|nr:EAL domain-containing protein [Thermoleophilaceae bacterium]
MTRLATRRLDEAVELGHGLVAGLAGAGALIVDVDLHILAAEGEAFGGLAYTDIIGRRVRDVVPSAAWDVLEPRYGAALTGQVQAFDYAAVTTLTTHRLRMAPIQDEGAVIGLMVLAEDVTEERHAAERLAESLRMQESVLDVMDEGIVVLDAARNLLQANSAALAMLAIDLGAARADPDWWRRYDWRSAADGQPVQVDRIAFRTGTTHRDVDVLGELPDGTHARYSVNVKPLRNGEGDIEAMVVSFRDVTGQMRSHQDLVDSQERLRAAYDVARLSSWELDPETDEVQVFQALNAHHTLTGTTVPLKEILAGLQPEDLAGARADHAALAAGDKNETVRRARMASPEGEMQWLETRMRAVHDARGRLIRIRGSTQDVTEQELAKRETAAARDFFQTTLDSLSAHIAVLDDQGGIIMTNRAWVEFAAAGGAEPEDLGDNYLEACDAAPGEPDAMTAAAGLRSIMGGEQDEMVEEYPCAGPNGEAWFLLRAVRFDGPGDACVVVSHEDVTDRHLAQQDVATQAALLDEVDVAVVATDNEGLVTRWSRGAEDLYGWTADEIVGLVAAEVLSPAGSNESALYDGEVNRLGRASGEFDRQRRDGSTFPAAVHGRVMLDADDRPAGRVNVSVDVSERVASERALRAARNYMRAVADSMGEGMFTLDAEGRLTYMNEAAESLLGWPFAELDGRVFHGVAHFRRPDGSDFPIEECPILQARSEGRTMRVEDDMFIRSDGRELPVAYTSSPFETADDEGCVVVFDDISERKATEDRLQAEADKLAWIARIQDALAEDRFVLYAQPIVDVAGGDVVQNELLLRMREPDGEIIPPGEYLHIAEEYGLIGEIDRWVVGRGIALAAEGRPVEINLSARSVGDQEILDHIEACLASSGADPSLIVFEITETAIVEDQGAAVAFTERLHTIGCKLALDDFGTGYGGFTYIKQLPVDYLKIDIEFVRDLTTNPASRHVVEAVVGLARGFGLETVAEGVEDAETYALLGEIGVDLAQGYHIARPGPLGPETTGART